MFGFEYMLNALRLHQPIHIIDFEQRTGMSLDAISAPLDIAMAKQLLTIDKQHIRKTKLGQTYLNNVLELFL
jgi:oxygen-independent coproporphyrinogen-3 oxidase